MSQKSPSSKNIPTNYWLMGQGVLENLAGCVQILQRYFYIASQLETTWNRVNFWVETWVIFIFKLALKMREDLLRKSQRENLVVSFYVYCTWKYRMYNQPSSDLNTRYRIVLASFQILILYFESLAEPINTSCENIHIHNHGIKTCSFTIYTKAVVSLVIPIRTGAGIVFLSMFSPSPLWVYTSVAFTWSHIARGPVHTG